MNDKGIFWDDAILSRKKIRPAALSIGELCSAKTSVNMKFEA